jgi:hypothetical protein
MKWESKSLWSVYTYTIDIDKLLTPVYHLVLDVAKGTYAERLFNEWAGEVFDIRAITGRDALDEKMTDELFLIEISRYLKGFLYANLDKLDGTVIQLLYEPKGLLVAPSRNKPAQALIAWIKRAEMMKAFLDLVKYGPVCNLKETLVKLLNDQYFGAAVKANEESALKAAVIPINALEGYEVLPVDPESIWINNKLSKELDVNEGTECGEVKFPNIDGISLMIGDFVFPLTGIDLYVKEDAKQNYFWKMLSDIYVNKKKSISIYREQSGEFKAAFKTSEFAQLMAKLQYNLYIKKEGQTVPEAYRQFFEEVYNIEEFIDKNNQILFTGTHLEEQVQNKQTMLGIYNTEKDGTDYNLHAWVNVETEDRQKKTEAGGVEDISIKTVYALKPQYSYYFASTYFEDLFQEVLQELEIETLHDVELSLSENPGSPYIEVDNFVRRQDGTIVFIENKTTLNRYNIEETVSKIAKFHQVMIDSYPSIHIEYLIAAPYMNETVEEAYSYFMNVEGCTATNFFIPIARFNGIRLHCVIEPEYEKLKAMMAELLK